MREEVAPLRIFGIGRSGIDLPRQILAMNETFVRPAASPCSDDQHLPTAPGQLALHSQQSRTQIKDEVVALVSERQKDTNPELHCLERDGLLCKRALLIRRQHRQQR
jgi:hypothetical protein